MTLTFEKLTNSPFSEHTHLIANELGECLVIDPGGRAEEVLALMDRAGWQPLAILLTHGHCDHVAGVMPIAEQTGVPIYLHPDDRQVLATSAFYWKFIAKEAFFGPAWSDITPIEGTALTIGGFNIQVLQTPGHTPGSCVFCINDIVICGDTFFRGTIGRTDLVGGEKARLAESIAALPAFDGARAFLPGHGPIFTADDLLAHNTEFIKLRAI